MARQVITKTAQKLKAPAAQKAPMATPKPMNMPKGGVQDSAWISGRDGQMPVGGMAGIAGKLKDAFGQGKGLLAQPPAQSPAKQPMPYKRVSPGMYQGSDGKVVRSQDRQQAPQQPSPMNMDYQKQLSQMKGDINPGGGFQMPQWGGQGAPKPMYQPGQGAPGYGGNPFGPKMINPASQLGWKNQQVQTAQQPQQAPVADPNQPQG